jgi:hypothetical protein
MAKAASGNPTSPKGSGTGSNQSEAILNRFADRLATALRATPLGAATTAGRGGGYGAAGPDLAKADYNRLARDDSQIEFAPVINFVVLFTQYNSFQHK